MQILIEFNIVLLLFPLFLINELMNSSNYFINLQFIKYIISAGFDVRDKFLIKVTQLPYDVAILYEFVYGHANKARC